MTDAIPPVHLSGKPEQLGQSLEALRTFIDAAAARAGIEKQKHYGLRLAADEIATNIISYGYGRSGINGTLDVSAHIDAEHLILIFEDTAPAFDPFSIPTPDNLDAPLEERGIGGLGIMLARQNVDDFTYARIGNRNQNRFVVKRPPANR